MLTRILLLVLAAICHGSPIANIFRNTQDESVAGLRSSSSSFTRAYFDSEISKYQSKIQQLTGRTTEGKDVAFASKEELPLLWSRLGELYLERNEIFNARGLNFGLQSTNTAIYMLLAPTSSSSPPTPEEVDQKALFRALLNRAMIHTKMNKEVDALSDLERALKVASELKDEYDMRTLKSSALLQKAYVHLTLKNEPMESMLMLNESLMLNPCANLNTETHSKLIYAIDHNDYFDSEDWDEFITNVILTDFGDDGIKACARFLSVAADNQQVDGKVSDMNYIESEVRKIVQSININWMLYNVYEATGKRNTAWSHLKHAHRVDREKFGARVDNVLRKITDDTKDIIEVYDDADFWNDRPAGSSSTMPVFIVGFFRSGSTLLENMLVQHPSVGTLGESSIFVEHLQSFRDATAMSSSSKKEKAENEGSEYEVSIREEELLRNHTNSYLKSIITAIREDYPEKQNIIRTIDKMLWNFRNLGVIQSMLPHSYIIHVIRDPLDTLVSCYKTQFKGAAGEWTSSESSLVKVYSEYLRVIQHFHKVLPGPGKNERIILVTYESLVLDTKKTMEYILDALNLPWSDKVLKTSLRKSKLAYTASLMQVKSSVYNTSIGSWRNVSNHLKTMKKELHKHDKLLKKMRTLMSGKSIANEYKQLSRFYRLNWGLDPDFDYFYSLASDRDVGDNEYSEVNVPPPSENVNNENYLNSHLNEDDEGEL